MKRKLNLARSEVPLL